MASWKEKGVVPDSDDEGSLDSESNGGDLDHEQKPRFNDDDGLTREENRNFEPGNLQVDAVDLEEAFVEDIMIDEEPTLPEPVAPSVPEVVDRNLFPPSSPRSPQGFKVPQTLWDPELEFTRSKNDATRREQDLPEANRLPVQDDISTSYVCFTSTVSSLLSSPPTSQQWPASNSQRDISRDQGKDELGILERISTANSHMNKDANSHASAGLFAPYRRELRRRAPIQLHPYAMEQEKYRQSLKARGLKPMRLAQTQDDGDATGNMYSPAPESQDAESQLIEQDTEESQRMDFSWNSELSPPQRNVEDEVKRSQVTGGPASSDDEFPDIDELLRRPAKSPAGSKRRMNVYSSKPKRPRLSKIQTQRDEAKHLERRALFSFGIPASPPTTSSPISTVTRIIQPSASQAVSVSSKEPTPSWLDQDELASPSVADLSTPPTSVIKPVSDPILLYSEPDDDPFASEQSDSTSSSSGESIQLRKVGKKIRGVLPASHLRLDQQLKKQKPLIHPPRDSHSVSPQKSATRRGVALPRVPGATQATPLSANQGINFFSDESEDEGEPRRKGPSIEEDFEVLENIFLANRRGYAEEEDRIDAMLPSGRRQKIFSTKSRKKVKMTSAPSSINGHRGQTFQPRITEHLEKHTVSKSHTNQRPKKGKSSKGSYKKTSTQSVRLTPPRLSILDVTDTVDHTTSYIPQFIKVAARTARSKVSLGKQSPSKKFIRLANREDTNDAQSVLDDWKTGKIKPRTQRSPVMKSVEQERPPLGRLANNRQTRLPPPLGKVKPRSLHPKAGVSPLGLPRQLIVPKGQQMSMNSFISVDQPTHLQPYSNAVPRSRSSHHIAQRLPANPRYRAPQARPAQLESSEIEYSRRNPAAAFKTTKKALDNVFRNTRKLSAQQKNLQLDRFLADDDLVRPSIELPALPIPKVSVDKASRTEPTTIVSKQRKRIPQRIDANAVQYRQPSEALIIDLVIPPEAEGMSQESKLMGLGNFGVRYPTNFDIFPLQSGIFFHESTFIGSGRLSEALQVTAVISPDTARGHTPFRLGDREFRWGPWNEDVSSQMGLVFDFILDQLPNLSEIRTPEIDLAGLMTLMVDYVQHHLSFRSSEGLVESLTRMFEVIQEFSSRIAAMELSVDRQKPEPKIDVMARCTVLVMQLLQIARGRQSSIDLQLESLLQNVAKVCIKLCLHEGLDTIRKLYDDLQYLSFRERGIRSDQYAAHAWVVVLRVMDAVRIPRGSFWDVTNTALVEVDMNSVDDARIMEKIWHSMFSLLPLCEFDEFGVIIPDLRQKVSFDNWLLPQRMLKRVFTLYSSNTRQSPSFNEYCRALVSRCHFLMSEWGWRKCTGIIGTLFDFFASRKLAHLRNEEVYKSPQFLEELAGEPSLTVEPEDRCFHIFLKIVALYIKHLRKIGDLKSIRNSVARLLPNHDRQYPKDEDIHQRQLAALRNHHDLLCTLYWSSPRDCRPSLNLIQDLVSADSSHKEACLINLRAWGSLARHVFTSSENETTSYQQFIDWQDSFFDKLLQQYLHKETEVRIHAELLLDSEKVPITEAELMKTVDEDRKSTMATMEALLYDLNHNIKNASSPYATTIALNYQLLSRILTPKIYDVYRDISQRLISSAVKALESYMSRIDSLHPLALAEAEFESQESLDLASMNIVERQIMIDPLHEYILPGFAAVTREILECRLYQPSEPTCMQDLVSCWARLVSFVTEEKYGLEDFVMSSPNAVFQNRQRYPRADKYWPLFLSLLLRDKGINGLKALGFDLGTEWMQVVTRPPALLTYESSLSRRLFQQGHYLLRSNPELNDWNWLSPELEWPNRHQHMVIVALNSMRMIKTDPTYGGFGDTQQLDERETQALFSAVLKSTMDSMQYHLESMIPASASHTEYVAFCQHVTCNFRAHTNNIRPLSDFFIRHSINYWPKVDDPQLYGAGIISYSLRLNGQSSKAHLELFYYLYSGWKHDQIHSRLRNHITCVRKGLKEWSFTEFMLAHFVPATLFVGFGTAGGSILTKIYLPALAKRVPHYLERNGPEGAATYKHVITIMKMIVNNVFLQAANAHAPYSQDAHAHWAHSIEDTIHGIHPEHRGILSIVCQFYIAIRPALLDYVAKFPAESAALEEISNLMNDFLQMAALPREQRNTDCVIEHLEINTSEYVDRFVSALEEDIEKFWVIEQGGNLVSIKSGGTNTKLSLVEGVPRFEDVLKLGICHLDGVGPESLVRLTDYMGNGKAFPGVMPPIF